MALPDWDAYEAAVDDAIATCDGDQRGALRALLHRHPEVLGQSRLDRYKTRGCTLASYAGIRRCLDKATTGPVKFYLFSFVFFRF
jgi:hypothetical protein